MKNHKLTHSEEVKGVENSHSHHKKMHDHHMKEAKKHMSHLHKMAKDGHKEHHESKKVAKKHEHAGMEKYERGPVIQHKMKSK